MREPRRLASRESMEDRCEHDVLFFMQLLGSVLVMRMKGLLLQVLFGL